MLRSLWRNWRAARTRDARVGAYVAALIGEPPAEDVRWLSEYGSGGDADHARWELRYARRALGLVAAQRDALDDRTASDVARALDLALATDPSIAPEKRRIASRQLNARLRGYREAVARREAPGTGYHLGRALLDFAGHPGAPHGDVIARAGDILSRYLEDAGGALRDCFGAAALPEDIAPSALAQRR